MLANGAYDGYLPWVLPVAFKKRSEIKGNGQSVVIQNLIGVLIIVVAQYLLNLLFKTSQAISRMPCGDSPHGISSFFSKQAQGRSVVANGDNIIFALTPSVDLMPQPLLDQLHRLRCLVWRDLQLERDL